MSVFFSSQNSNHLPPRNQRNDMVRFQRMNDLEDAPKGTRAFGPQLLGPFLFDSTLETFKKLASWLPTLHGLHGAKEPKKETKTSPPQKKKKLPTMEPSVLHSQVVRGVACCNHLGLKVVASGPRLFVEGNIFLPGECRSHRPVNIGKTRWAPCTTNSFQNLLKSQPHIFQVDGEGTRLLPSRVFESPTQKMELSLRLEVCIL